MEGHLPVCRHQDQEKGIYLVQAPITPSLIIYLDSLCCFENFDCHFFFGQIVFVENKKLTPTLLEDINETQLPDIYGGKMPLTPIHDSH